MCPDLHLVESWPCEKKLDGKAMDHAWTFQGLKRVGSSETFKTEDIEGFISHQEQFFRTTTNKDT